jgi:hypothetical protein
VSPDVHFVANIGVKEAACGQNIREATVTYTTRENLVTCQKCIDIIRVP